MDVVLLKYKHVFVYTKPKNVINFEGLGFNLIETAKPLYSVLEFGFDTISTYQKYLKGLKKDTETNKVACVVVNCNPFTNGHKYLIETAASINEIVYLFIVEEDKSAFGFNVRWNLVKAGISHLNNVVMVKGGRYIVSSGIFPSYFLKKEALDEVAKKQTELDVKIFAKYFVPILGITKRYVGTENYCNTTAAYNETMKEILPKAGVEVVEVTRKCIGVISGEPNFISASKVRNAIKEDNLDSILDFLPETTKEFLLSPDSDKIKEKIKGSVGRH
jgi:[citrate (pro-3S)-lyase] ligase